MIEILSDHQALLRLREPWNALAAGFANPLLRHECAVACAEAFAEPGRLAVFVARSGDDVRAIASFHAVRRAGIRRLHALTRPLREPAGFLYRDGDALTELLEGVLADGHPLMLGRLPAGGAELRTLQDLSGRRSGLPRASRDDSSVWVPLRDDWPQFEAGMSSARRAYVRRKWRRAERLGRVEFEALTPDGDSAVPALREAYRVEAAGWKGRNGSAILQTPRYERFFTDYSLAAARLGMLRLYTLKIGGEAAAVRIAVEHADRLWELKIGYDERFQDCSPGILLTHETLRHACGQGLSAFEFLGQAEEWEFAWTEQVHRYTSLTLHPLSVGGSLSLAQDLCWDFAKTALRALRVDTDSRKERSRNAGAAT